jgi:DNA gyrase subunit A
VVVRTRVSEVRALGRATQGVTLISIDEGATLVGVQRIADTGDLPEVDDASEAGMPEGADDTDSPAAN